MPVSTPASLGYNRSGGTNALVVIPTTATNFTTSDTIVYQVFVHNQTAASTTVTIADRASPALTICNGESLASKARLLLSFPEGLTMTNGITWSVGNANVVGAIKCFVKG
jgi:hypothetical protein